jgi:hypothetical protein
MVGVEGGIPSRTTVCASLDAATYGNGASGATAAIQAALDACPAGQVVSLSAGVFRLDASLRLVRSNITLRGAGMAKTVLLADDLSYAVMIGREYGALAAVNITSGYSKGSTELVLEDAASVAVGAFVLLDELNDSGIPVSNVGIGTCTWCGRANGTRVRGQLVRVTGKTGNTVTIDPPMYFTFSLGNQPQVLPLGGPLPSRMATEYSGIEDLTIQNNWQPSKVRGTDGREYSAFRSHTSASTTQPTTGASWVANWVETSADGSAAPVWQTATAYDGDYDNQRVPLNVALAANCWAKNLKIERAGARCVQLFYNVHRFELRDSHIKGCINRWDSNNCYGTLIGWATSGVLIENNIYESVADGPMFAWGASGNVVGYNYIRDGHRTMNAATWFNSFGGSHHGAHTAFNLWEGNKVESLYFDDYWGSHSHNTLFRNRAIGKYIVAGIVTNEASLQNVITVVTEKDVHHQSYLGNVLGTAGYHTRYERNAEGCPNAFYDKLIYRTGYASSGSCEGSDPNAFTTLFRHMNYDFVSSAFKRCDDPGEPGCQGSSGGQQLPDSLYLPAKPAWWGALTWPAFGPTNDDPPQLLDGTIPAEQRWAGEAGFVPLAPCRAFDTRDASGAPALVADSRRVFAIAGRCGIPADAKAISGNLTVVAATAQGDLRVVGGHLESTLTSALSIPLSRARANNAIIQLSTSGADTIAVINGSPGTVHLILDINGYFR